MIAEDLLLLLTDDDTGKPVVDTTRLDLALGGAVLVELIDRGRLDLTGEGRKQRVVVADATPTGDPVLDEALGRVVDRQRTSTPQDWVPRLARNVRGALWERLAERGILRAEEGRILGIFPTRSWPAADSAHEDALRRGLHGVLVIEQRATPEEATLVALLDAIDVVPKVLAADGVDRRTLKARAKQVAEGQLAGVTVKKAVEAATAAVVAVMVATTMSTSD